MGPPSEKGGIARELRMDGRMVGDASMGPPSEKGGINMKMSATSARYSCFNGAALREGRNRTWSAALPKRLTASMGPPSEKGGITYRGSMAIVPVNSFNGAALREGRNPRARRG